MVINMQFAIRTAITATAIFLSSFAAAAPDKEIDPVRGKPRPSGRGRIARIA